MSDNNSFFLHILKRIFGLYVKVAYSNVPLKYIYFIRDTYVCRAYQLKYFIKDYIIKKSYKNISFQGEFGAEMMFALPFAYWHFKNGTLKSTSSFPYTRDFYFFSDNHEEIFTERTNEGNYNFELPRVLYSHDYNMKKWLPVPLKEVYRNNIYIFEKPIVIIANRYNMEWDGPPISYFSIDILDFMISNLSKKYTIVYNRPQPKNIVNDNSEVYDLNEFDWLQQKYPEVVIMENLYNEHKSSMKNFNHFQLCIYANCNNFISVHGGTSTLASYFGGTNIIYSEEGGEHYFKCFEKLYPKFSGAKIHHAKNEDELKNLVIANYL